MVSIYYNIYKQLNDELSLRYPYEIIYLFPQALKDENRILNRLVKRQNSALERLVGAQGELPVLLHAHNEETRILKHKMKQVSFFGYTKKDSWLHVSKKLKLISIFVSINI